MVCFICWLLLPEVSSCTRRLFASWTRFPTYLWCICQKVYEMGLWMGHETRKTSINYPEDNREHEEKTMTKMITIFTWWCWQKKRTGRYHSEWKSLTYNVDNSMTDSQFFFCLFPLFVEIRRVWQSIVCSTAYLHYDNGKTNEKEQASNEWCQFHNDWTERALYKSEQSSNG